MSPLEATFWRAEVDPRLHSSGVVLDVLDRSPDWTRLVDAHEWAVRSIPRLRQRVVEDPLHLGPPRWVTTAVDLDRHLSRITLKGGKFDEVLEVAAGLHMEPLDRSRPLWRAILVDGLADGSASYLFKVHHSVADGTGIVQLFDLLHSDRAKASPDKPMPAPEPAENITGAGLLVRRSLSLAGAAPAYAVKAAATGLRAATNPKGVVEYVSSAARIAGGSGATPSPLFAKRGLDRELRVLEIPLERLRDAGRAAGGSVNDAFIAGLLGGFRRYYEWHQLPLTDLSMALPVGLRTAGDAAGGNHFAAASIAGPVGEADPVERIRLVRKRILAVREEPALDMLGQTAPIASHLPSPVLAKVAGKLSQSLDLQASNIPGLNRPCFIAGARITRMFVFGPVPGCAVMITMLTHEGTSCIGVATDAAAVQDPDLLVAFLDTGMQEVTALS